MSDVILHIGLHKTATTTLQSQYFPACKGLRYLSGDHDIGKFVQAVTITDPIYFDANSWRLQVLPLLSRDAPNLISKESLSGALYAGIGKSGLDHRTPILQNLRETLPESRIILVIRRQDGLARSVYRQYLKVGGTETIKIFYGYDGGRSPLFSLNRFRFGPYIDKLVSMFPAGVLILPFEDLISDRGSFFSRLNKFIGVENPHIDLQRANQTRLGSTGMEVSRWMNCLFRSQLNPAGLLPGIPRIENGKIKWLSPAPSFHDKWPLQGSVSERSDIYQVCKDILKNVQEDNRILDERYNLGLAAKQYY